MGLCDRLLRRQKRPLGPLTHLIRETDLVTDEQVEAIAAACDIQVRYHLAPAHWLLPCPVRASRASDVIPTHRAIYLIDDAGDGALGWHTEQPGDVVMGVVGVRTILDHTGSVLSGANSVSAVASHEVCEVTVNAHVSGWADTGRGHLVAKEVCDPVQSHAYDIPVHDATVAVSDFVTHEWFSAIHQLIYGDSYDYMGVLSEPFQVAEGGYVLTLANGQVEPVFGAGFPDWLWPLKQRDTARTRRLTIGRPQ